MKSVATRTDHDYHSFNMGATLDSVSIKELDICHDCNIYILIYGFQTSRFTIVASLSDETISLKGGLPQSGSVAANNQQFYSYTVTSRNDTSTVRAIVTPLSGGHQLQVLMSTSFVHPNSSTSSSDGVLQDLKPGEMVYIAVSSESSPATYTIRVSEDGSTVFIVKCNIFYVIS